MQRRSRPASFIGSIRAFGILAFNCHPAKLDDPGCDDGPTLTLFTPRATVSRATILARAIADGARNGAAADFKGLGDNLQAPLRGVVTRVVSSRLEN